MIIRKFLLIRKKCERIRFYRRQYDRDKKETKSNPFRWSCTRHCYVIGWLSQRTIARWACIERGVPYPFFFVLLPPRSPHRRFLPFLRGARCSRSLARPQKSSSSYSASAESIPLPSCEVAACISGSTGASLILHAVSNKSDTAFLRSFFFAVCISDHSGDLCCQMYLAEIVLILLRSEYVFV